MNLQTITTARKRLESAKYWHKAALEFREDDYSLVALRCLYLSFLQCMRSALITIDIDPAEEEEVVDNFWNLFVVNGDFSDALPLIKELYEIPIAMDFNDEYHPIEFGDSVCYYRTLTETLLNNVSCWIETKYLQILEANR